MQAIRNAASAILKPLIILLFLISAFIWITGGWDWRTSIGRIEANQMDLFVAFFALFLFIYKKLRREPLEADLGPVGWSFRKLEALLENPELSKKLAYWFIGVVFGLLFIAHLLRHWSLGTDGYDVSFVHQALFYPWQNGTLLKVDVLPSGTTLETHQTWVFLLIAPLVSWARSDELIFLLQTVLSALPLVLLIKYGPIRDRKAIFFFAAVVLLSQRGFRNSLVFDFREDLVAYGCFSGMILSLYYRKLWVYFLLLLIALSAKENMFAVVLFFAGPILLSGQLPLSKKERWALAGSTALLSLVYAAVAFKVLIPMFAGPREGSHPLFVRFGAYGSSASEVLISAVTRLDFWTHQLSFLFEKSALKYFLYLFGPFLFFFRSRQSWIWLIPALPGIGANVLHDYRTQRIMLHHYELIIVPFLMWGVLSGMQKIPTERKRVWIWGLIFALMFSGRWPGHEITDNWPTREQIASSFALNSIPADSTVSTNMRLSAQLNHVRNLEYRFSWNEDADGPHVDYFVYDLELENEAQAADRLMQEKGFELVPGYSTSRVVTLKRGSEQR